MYLMEDTVIPVKDTVKVRLQSPKGLVPNLYLLSPIVGSLPKGLVALEGVNYADINGVWIAVRHNTNQAIELKWSTDIVTAESVTELEGHTVTEEYDIMGNINNDIPLVTFEDKLGNLKSGKLYHKQQDNLKKFRKIPHLKLPDPHFLHPFIPTCVTIIKFNMELVSYDICDGTTIPHQLRVYLP